RNFKPQTYWRIQGQFAVDAGTYEGYLHKEAIDRKSNDHDRHDRLWDGEQAQAIFKSLQEASVATAADEKKRLRQSSGRLYDLTSLQREANGRYGFSATRTLQIAQALYERHKV